MLSYLILHFHCWFLLIFASLILKPDPYNPTRQTRHFNQLLFHKSIWTRVSWIATLHHMQLLLCQYCSDPSGSTSSLLLLWTNLLISSQRCGWGTTRYGASCTFTLVTSIKTNRVISWGKSSFNGSRRFFRATPIIFAWNKSSLLTILILLHKYHEYHVK